MTVTTNDGYQLIKKDTSSIDAVIILHALLEHKLNNGKQHDTLHRVCQRTYIFGVLGMMGGLAQVLRLWQQAMMRSCVRGLWWDKR